MIDERFPVCSGTGAQVKNVFETIICKRRARKKMGTIVDDIMTRNPITIRAEDPLQKAIQLMEANSVKRLVVSDPQNKVEGVVSRVDLLRSFGMK